MELADNLIFRGLQGIETEGLHTSHGAAVDMAARLTAVQKALPSAFLTQLHREALEKAVDTRRVTFSARRCT